MPLWCIQENECLACQGGCEGFETKRVKMREAREAFWRAVRATPEWRAMEDEWHRCAEDLQFAKLSR